VGFLKFMLSDLTSLPIGYYFRLVSSSTGLAPDAKFIYKSIL